MHSTSMFHLTLRSLAPALALCLAGACHSTQVAATWSEPTARPLSFHRSVTVFASKSETYRRTMEDKMAAQFPNAVPSYRVLGSTDVNDANAVRKVLADSGFDGAIMMHVAQVENEVNYTPSAYYYGAPYASFAGYWGSAWGYPYDPGYYTTDVVVSVETEIYSLKNDKLIWAARTETTNPDSAEKLGSSVIKHVKHQLKKDGLLAQ